MPPIFKLPFIKLPNWLHLVIKKRLYLIIPLAALSISNYIKDIKLDRLGEERNDLDKVVQALVLEEISKAGFIEQTNLIFWVKELIPEKGEFRIIYVSPSYKLFLKRTMNRHELIGRTGRYIDDAFGDIYQKNDWTASKLDEPKVFPEPFKYYGIGNVITGDFLKGRIKNTGQRVLVFGLFVKEIKNENN